MAAEPRGVATREVQRWDGTTLDASEEDRVAVEEPLEIRVSGDPVATTMRTPGNDRELAVGFLFAEGLLHSVDDLGGLAHCGRPGEEGWGNVLEVTPAPGVLFDVERLATTRRGTLTTSACGVCGRRSVSDLLERCDPPPPGPPLSPQLMALAAQRLQEAQRNFERTGGVHAAAALDASGQVLAAYEDVGRHNAVDKVVGALVLAGKVRAPSRARPQVTSNPPVALVVSSRASFEIVQKAITSGLSMIVSFSAASSLAIDLALRSGVTLAAFARNGRCNIYAGASRLALPPRHATP
ncbi:formate dehydrogenase accessory sulfurtransferase FdhD [Corallococcus sp. M34]|uniref:formate dehydrogenase accessory sulfurtransferase FdhD n=1 Tax=Citreicoccus inhibens TaxID=2849499 RepID=UPI001C2318CC|nr:formate dehydrogenase accessory sulfurtransferase FdhD [Citreicoccus inhibens]MBU8897276.1 formate dehydrogenase accessory sulfurtransferase FdhD [Citreicoccus inhibens]